MTVFPRGEFFHVRNALGLEMPMDAEVAEMLRVLPDSNGPVNFGPESDHPLPAKAAEHFSALPLNSYQKKQEIQAVVFMK